MDRDEGDDFDLEEILTDVAEIEGQVNVQLVMMLHERWKMKLCLLILMVSIDVPDVLNRNQEIQNELLDSEILPTTRVREREREKTKGFCLKCKHLIHDVGHHFRHLR